MALLKTPNTAPPGGYKYRQSETGLVVTGDSLNDLVSKVASHRRYKGLKPDGAGIISLEVQRQICARLGTDHCIAEEADTWVPVSSQPRRLTLNDMMAFSKVALEFIKNGGRMTDFDEAKRRAAVCRDCPLNQPASGCKCGTFYKMINASIPVERKFAGLDVCQACACSCVAKVNVPMEVIKADTRPIEYPVNCWMRD